MSDCQSVDALVTPLIDGELPAADRDRLERHLKVCTACYSRVEAERAVRAVIHEHHRGLKSACAPVALRVKCASHCQVASTGPRPWRWNRLLPLAAAAVVIVGVGAVMMRQGSGPSARVMAMELASDHVKCFEQPPQDSPEAVEASMASLFGWNVDLDNRGDADLELLGARQCSYDGGKVAHIMFRHGNQPMSLYMLPKATYDREVIDALGQHCAIWAKGDRTFVLVSPEPRAEVERVVARVQTTLH